MATATMVLNDMHRLFDGGTLAGQGDGQLLEAFVGQGDEAAFAGLVTRHGPMVLGTCRAVLRDPDAAEDVFQATFLVLARKAGSVRGRDALGGWLHRVAFRAAVQANRAAARRRAEERKAAEMRASTAVRDDVRDDLRSLIHAEVERLPEPLRLPVVLCDLQGLTREQAADELRWTEGTVRGRLARGRAKLKARLARAGLAPSVAGLTAAMAREASAVVPEAWVAATARAASATLAGKAAGAAATAIAAGVLRTMLVARLKTAAGVVLAIVAVAGASFGVVVATGGIGETEPGAPAVARAATPAPPADGPIVYEGRVLGPDGKPFEGAKLAINTSDEPSATPPPARARSGADGRFRFEVTRSEFKIPPNVNVNDVWRSIPVVASADGYGPDWAALEGYDARPGGDGGLTLRLVEPGTPIAGRVLDLQGRPVAGATVRIARIERPSGGNLDAFLRAWKVASSSAESLAGGGGNLFFPALAGLPAEVKADAQGRFQIRGIGKDRAVRLLVSAPAHEETEIRVITRAGVDLKELAKVGPETEMMNGKPNRFGPPLHGPTFDLLVGPGRTLEGVVREAGTGRPIAGVHVGGGGEGHSQHLVATTGKDGRYRIAGLPVAAPIRLDFFPPPGEPLLPASQKIEPREGATALTAEIEMTRGITARGRVVDRDTGKPVVGMILYQPLAGNTAFRDTPAGEFIAHVMNANPMEKDGTFRVVVGPGPGAILVQIHRTNGAGLTPDYLPANRVPNDGAPGFGGNQDMLTGAANQAITLFTYHAYAVINPKPGDAEVSCELKVVRGRSKGGTVLDPDGKPLAGASISGLVGPYEGGSETLAGAEFTVTTLNPARPRYLVASHAARKLAGARVVRGDEPGSLDLRLEPWGTVTGRLVDGDGHPIAGARIGMGYRGEGGAAVPGLGGRSPEERLLTDGDGRFRVEGVVPGLKAVFWATKQGRQFQSGKALEDLSLRPGETRDLGDVAAEPIQ